MRIKRTASTYAYASRDGRGFFYATMIVGAACLLLLQCVASAQTVADPEASPRLARSTVAKNDAGPQNESIRPFRFTASEDALADLRRRILATRWPEKEPVADATQGVQLATMRKLAEYWASDYDWRKCEATLNALPQFITQIDGLDIHFIHVRSKHPNALPIIVTHGWPGSIVEQLKIIGPLTDP